MAPFMVHLHQPPNDPLWDQTQYGKVPIQDIGPIIEGTNVDVPIWNIPDGIYWTLNLKLVGHGKGGIN